MRFFSKQFFDSMSYSFDIQQCTVCRKKISQSFYVTSCVFWESNLYIDYRTIQYTYSVLSAIVVVAAVFRYCYCGSCRRVHAHTHTHERTFGSFRFGRFFSAWQNFSWRRLCVRAGSMPRMYDNDKKTTTAHWMRARQRPIDLSRRAYDGLVKPKNLVLAETTHNKNKCVKFTQAQKLMPMCVWCLCVPWCGEFSLNRNTQMYRARL